MLSLPLPVPAFLSFLSYSFLESDQVHSIGKQFRTSGLDCSKTSSAQLLTNPRPNGVPVESGTG
jgi:hypothetical protein